MDASALRSLVDKIESLDLTDEERALLDTVLERAASGPDVEGFGVVYEIETKFKGSDEELQAFSPMARKFAFSLGLIHEHQNPYIGETEKN